MFFTEKYILWYLTYTFMDLFKDLIEAETFEMQKKSTFMEKSTLQNACCD